MKKALLLLLLMTVVFSGCKKEDPLIVEYTVSFDSQGGSELSPVKVSEGSKVTKPQDPTKENYIFSGWYKEAACTTVWDFEKETVMSNVTLYAKWVEAAQACVVTFDTQGGSEVAPLTVNKGEKLVKPTDPTKTDCSFLGWYKDAAYTDVWEFSTDVVNGDITLYARWSNPDETVYTVTFDTDGGNEMEPVSVKANEKVIKPANPVKVGFDFKGWYSDPEKVTVYDFESLVTADITLYAKWLKSEVALVDFEAGADLEANGILWDEATRTLDITNATGSATIYFNVTGISSIKAEPIPAYDTHAYSIGGAGKLNDIVITGATVDGKISMEVKTPVQSLNVPLDIYVTISDISNPEDAEVITIKSRPNYADTELQPVMMATTDGKTVFWAPLNIGATKMPESLADASDNNNPKDITESCGKLFQWGRKDGVSATNDASKIGDETFTGERPKGQGALADMSSYKGKFIKSSSSPNSQGNWLLFNADGSANPGNAEMTDLNAWYQQLWNKGTEDAPVKTEYDPCPEGWRVPTLSEWQAIGADVSSVTKEWDGTNKLMSIVGAESGQKLVLPAAGCRRSSSGASGDQGSYGNYWSSSVPSGSTSARNVYFNRATLVTSTSSRAFGYSVRCVQE